MYYNVVRCDGSVFARGCTWTQAVAHMNRLQKAYGKRAVRWEVDWLDVLDSPLVDSYHIQEAA